MRASMVLAVAAVACGPGVIRPQRDAHGNITCTRRSAEPLQQLGLGLTLSLGGAGVATYGLYSVSSDAGDGVGWAVTAIGGGLITLGVAMFVAAEEGQAAIDDCEKLAGQQAMEEKELDDLARHAVEAARRGDCARAAMLDRELVAREHAQWIDGYRYDPDVAGCIPRAAGTSAAPLPR